MKKKHKNKATKKSARQDAKLEALKVQGRMQEARAKRFQAETKFKELKIAQIEGRVHETAQCIREQYQREMKIKHAFLDLGPQLAPQLLGRSMIEIESIITEKCCEIMRELAKQKEKT